MVCWPPRPPDNIKQVESEGESVEQEVEEGVVERKDDGDLSEDSSRADDDEAGSASDMVEDELEELLPARGEMGGRDGGEHVVEKGAGNHKRGSALLCAGGQGVEFNEAAATRDRVERSKVDSAVYAEGC